MKDLRAFSPSTPRKFVGLLLALIVTVFICGSQRWPQVLERPSSRKADYAQKSLDQNLAAQVAKQRDAYLTLLARTLTGLVYHDNRYTPKLTKLELMELLPFDQGLRENGQDWPHFGQTMVGLKRLKNIRMAIETVIAEGVEGDYLEAGVWRGGASIFAKGVLDSYESSRHSYVCDSFQGLPMNTTSQDFAEWSQAEYLRVSQEEVAGNFAAYNLLSDRVHFIKGFFRESMPTLPVTKLAVARLDGDMYESTLDLLFSLYGKVAVGGFVIIDDWPIADCRRAVEDFAKWHKIQDEVAEIQQIDKEGAAYFRKTRHVDIKSSIYDDFNSQRGH